MEKKEITKLTPMKDRNPNSGTCMDDNCGWEGLLSKCVDFEEEFNDFSHRVFSHPLCPKCGEALDNFYYAMSHEDIIKVGGKWLKKHTNNIKIPNCNLVLEDLKTATVTGEIPDIIGWCSWASVLIEVKTSWGDFLKDKGKPFRLDTSSGMGNFRYYICEPGLIHEDDVPENWGLLYVNVDGQIELIKAASKVEANLECERTMLLSVIRRKNK